MIDKINELAKAHKGPASILRIGADLYEELNKQFNPIERIVLGDGGPPIPPQIAKVHTENGVLTIEVVANGILEVS